MPSANRTSEPETDNRREVAYFVETRRNVL